MPSRLIGLVLTLVLLLLVFLNFQHSGAIEKPAASSHSEVSIPKDVVNPEGSKPEVLLSRSVPIPSQSGLESSESLKDIEPRPESLPALSVDDQLVKVIASGPSHSNLIALTFDDGPHPVYTPKILDELRKRKVKATFFVVGEMVKSHPWIVQQVIAEGHEIGNHTFNHRSLTGLSKEAAEREISDTQDTIRRMTGYETTLFRPPYGALRADTKVYLQLHNYQVILWSVDTFDWRVKNTEKIVTKVVEKTRKGSIILCHDINKYTVEALPQFLDLLIEQGYEFGTVNQLCGLPTLKVASVSSK